MRAVWTWFSCARACVRSRSLCTIASKEFRRVVSVKPEATLTWAWSLLPTIRPNTSNAAGNTPRNIAWIVRGNLQQDASQLRRLWHWFAVDCGGSTQVPQTPAVRNAAAYLFCTAAIKWWPTDKPSFSTKIHAHTSWLVFETQEPDLQRLL